MPTTKTTKKTTTKKTTTKKSTKTTTNYTNYLTDLETELAKIFIDKVPALPEGFKNFIVTVTPYFTLFAMIMMVPFILAFFGISAVFMPFSYLGGLHAGFFYTIHTLILISMIILEVIALPGLFKREAKAWKLIFYVTLISLLENLIGGNLGRLIINGAISFYFLFQIRDQYKN